VVVLLFAPASPLLFTSSAAPTDAASIAAAAPAAEVEVELAWSCFLTGGTTTGLFLL
jgi:hypothetical protein